MRIYILSKHLVISSIQEYGSNLVLGVKVIKTIAFQNMKLHCFAKYAFFFFFFYYTHCS